MVVRMAFEPPADEVRADEAGRAGDEEPHVDGVPRGEDRRVGAPEALHARIVPRDAVLVRIVGVVLLGHEIREERVRERLVTMGVDARDVDRRPGCRRRCPRRTSLPSSGRAPPRAPFRRGRRRGRPVRARGNGGRARRPCASATDSAAGSASAANSRARAPRTSHGRRRAARAGSGAAPRSSAAPFAHEVVHQVIGVDRLAGVAPEAVEDVRLQLAALDVPVVQIRDLELSAARRLERREDLPDLFVVEVGAGDDVAARRARPASR